MLPLEAVEPGTLPGTFQQRLRLLCHTEEVCGVPFSHGLIFTLSSQPPPGVLADCFEHREAEAPSTPFAGVLPIRVPYFFLSHKTFVYQGSHHLRYVDLD